jgi:putative flippase GtrA
VGPAVESQALRAVIWSLVRYAALMVPIALLDIGILHALVHAGMHYLLANIISFNVVNALFYVLSRRLIFTASGQGSLVGFLLFAAVGVVAIAIQSLVMWLAVDAGHWHYLVGKIAAMGITVIWTFTARRWLFANQRAQPMPATVPPAGQPALRDQPETLHGS